MLLRENCIVVRDGTSHSSRFVSRFQRESTCEPAILTRASERSGRAWRVYRLGECSLSVSLGAASELNSSSLFSRLANAGL